MKALSWMPVGVYAAGNNQQIAPVSVLLPAVAHNEFQVQVRVNGSGGCFNWQVEDPDLIGIRRATSIEIEYDAIESAFHAKNFSATIGDGMNDCVDSIIVAPLKTDGSKFHAYLTALDARTGNIIRADVYIDEIKHISIDTTVKNVEVDGYDTLRVRAYDAVGNSFTSLEGLPFRWTTSENPTVEFSSLATDSLFASSVRRGLDANGKFSDVALIRGVKNGTTEIQVNFDGGAIRTPVETASTQINIREPFKPITDDVLVPVGGLLPVGVVWTRSTCSRGPMEELSWSAAKCPCVKKVNSTTGRGIQKGECELPLTEIKDKNRVVYQKVRVIDNFKMSITIGSATSLLTELSSNSPSRTTELDLSSELYGERNQIRGLVFMANLRRRNPKYRQHVKLVHDELYIIQNNLTAENTNHELVYPGENVKFKYAFDPSHFQILSKTNNSAYILVRATGTIGSKGTIVNELNDIDGTPRDEKSSVEYEIVDPLTITSDGTNYISKRLVPARDIEVQGITRKQLRQFTIPGDKSHNLKAELTAPENYEIMHRQYLLMTGTQLGIHVRGGSGNYAVASSDDAICSANIDATNVIRLLAKNNDGTTLIWVYDREMPSMHIGLLCSVAQPTAIDIQAPMARPISTPGDSQTFTAVVVPVIEIEKLGLVPALSATAQYAGSFGKNMIVFDTCRNVKSAFGRDSDLHFEAASAHSAYAWHENPPRSCGSYSVAALESVGKLSLTAKVIRRGGDVKLSASRDVSMFAPYKYEVAGYDQILNLYKNYNLEARNNQSPAFARIGSDKVVLTSSEAITAIPIVVLSTASLVRSGGPLPITGCSMNETMDYNKNVLMVHANDVGADVTCMDFSSASAIKFTLTETCGGRITYKESSDIMISCSFPAYTAIVPIQDNKTLTNSSIESLVNIETANTYVARNVKNTDLMFATTSLAKRRGFQSARDRIFNTGMVGVDDTSINKFSLIAFDKAGKPFASYNSLKSFWALSSKHSNLTLAGGEPTSSLSTVEVGFKNLPPQTSMGLMAMFQFKSRFFRGGIIEGVPTPVIQKVQEKVEKEVFEQYGVNWVFGYDSRVLGSSLALVTREKPRFYPGRKDLMLMAHPSIIYVGSVAGVSDKFIADPLSENVEIVKSRKGAFVVDLNDKETIAEPTQPIAFRVLGEQARGSASIRVSDDNNLSDQNSATFQFNYTPFAGFTYYATDGTKTIQLGNEVERVEIDHKFTIYGVPNVSGDVFLSDALKNRYPIEFTTASDAASVNAISDNSSTIVLSGIQKFTIQAKPLGFPTKQLVFQTFAPLIVDEAEVIMLPHRNTFVVNLADNNERNASLSNRLPSDVSGEELKSMSRFPTHLSSSNNKLVSVLRGGRYDNVVITNDVLGTAEVTIERDSSNTKNVFNTGAKSVIDVQYPKGFKVYFNGEIPERQIHSGLNSINTLRVDLFAKVGASQKPFTLTAMSYASDSFNCYADWSFEDNSVAQFIIDYQNHSYSVSKVLVQQPLTQSPIFIGSSEGKSTLSVKVYCQYPARNNNPRREYKVGSLDFPVYVGKLPTGPQLSSGVTFLDVQKFESSTETLLKTMNHTLPGPVQIARSALSGFSSNDMIANGITRVGQILNSGEQTHSSNSGFYSLQGMMTGTSDLPRRPLMIHFNPNTVGLLPEQDYMIQGQPRMYCYSRTGSLTLANDIMEIASICPNSVAGPIMYDHTVGFTSFKTHSLTGKPIIIETEQLSADIAHESSGRFIKAFTRKPRWFYAQHTFGINGISLPVMNKAVSIPVDLIPISSDGLPVVLPPAELAPKFRIRNSASQHIFISRKSENRFVMLVDTTVSFNGVVVIEMDQVSHVLQIRVQHEASGKSITQRANESLILPAPSILVHKATSVSASGAQNEDRSLNTYILVGLATSAALLYRFRLKPRKSARDVARPNYKTNASQDARAPHIHAYRATEYFSSLK